MDSKIALLGEKIIIDADRSDFYEAMLKAIVERVFQLLGPEFDKKTFLQEVEKGRLPAEIGQELAIPVSIILSLELGYCLGQLKYLGRSMDCDKALADLYSLWKTRLKMMLQEEIITSGSVH
ncbi:MAG: hypothetical protein V1689_14680 [Pseudomonadota bacterium]